MPPQPRHVHPTAPLAPRALLPGDPGRALLLAQELTDEPRMFNHNRGLWGYTGTAPDGEPVTIMSHGMGGPSAAIVLEELCDLGLEVAIRIGSCGALDERLLRHRLREGDVGGTPRDELAVELVGYRDRAGELALAAAGTERLVDEARLAADGRVEAAVSVACDPADLGAGKNGDVRVVHRRGHLRRRDTARAVERREDLAEQDHLAADARLLLDDEHLVAHVA